MIEPDAPMVGLPCWASCDVRRDEPAKMSLQQ